MKRSVPLQIPLELSEAMKALYEPCDLSCTNIELEEESKEYAACRFTIGKRTILFRVAKTTPTKNGQFVTLWKRENGGPIVPFDTKDDIDLVIIITKTKSHSGQFIFPKNILLEKGIFSSAAMQGKRAMRVYPSWDKATSN